MFSLRQHIRRQAMMVAAVAAAVGFIAASQAAIWPDDVTSDTVTLSGGGSVDVQDDTYLNYLTLSGGNFTFDGEGRILLGTGISTGNGYTWETFTSNGTNTIKVPFICHSFTLSTVHVTGTLRIDNLQAGVGEVYGSFQKTGPGILDVGTIKAGVGIVVNDGTLLLSGTQNNANFVVENANDTFGTLAGNATVTYSGWGSSPRLQIDGHLAPGAKSGNWVQNDNGTFGTIGMLTFTGIAGSGAYYFQTNTFNFSETAVLDLDLSNPSQAPGVGYDAFQFGGRPGIDARYGIDTTALNIDSSAQVNINAVNGFLEEGSYHIITLNNGNGVLTGNFNVDNIHVFGLENGLTKDDYTFTFVPLWESGYLWEGPLDSTGSFVPVTICTGIDLVIGPKQSDGGEVPEPASLGLLGLGAGLLLLRRKR